MARNIWETQRLLLRPMPPADTQAPYAWLSDPDAKRFRIYSLYTCLADAQAWPATLRDEPGYTFGMETFMNWSGLNRSVQMRRRGCRML